MNDLVRRYLVRPKRYENIDGSGEICMGLMFLAFGLLSYLSALLPNNRWWKGLGGGLFMFAVLLPMLALTSWIRRLIKTRVTWPRTGYVAFPGGWAQWKKRLAIFFIAGVAGGAGVGASIIAMRHRAVSLFRVSYLAILVAIYALYVVLWSRDHPWKWLLVVLMALGLLGIAFTVPGESIWLPKPGLLFAGLVWIGSGGATLYLYIRHTQPPLPEAQ